MLIFYYKCEKIIEKLFTNLFHSHNGWSIMYGRESKISKKFKE